MRPLIGSTLWLALWIAGSGARVDGGQAPAGYVDFGKLAPPGAGGKFVEVNISAGLLTMAARLAHKTEPEVAEVLRGLKAARVHVVGLDNENRDDLEARVKALRAELDAKGWDRVVTAQGKGKDVGVHIKTRGEEAIEGVVVTVLEDRREAVFANLVGNVQPEKLAAVGEKLNLEPLKQAGEAIEKK